MPYDTAQAAPNLRAVLPSLLLKERIKLLRFGRIPFALVAAALVDFGLTMRTIAKMHGTAASWLGILEKEQILFERLLWAYVASGALWSLLQTVPECIEGRLRIAFHLPIDTRVSIAFPTFVGVALTALLALFGGVGFYLVCCLLGMPHELPALMLPALYPWMLTAPIAWCVVASDSLCKRPAPQGLKRYPTMIENIRWARLSLALVSLTALAWLVPDLTYRATRPEFFSLGAFYSDTTGDFVYRESNPLRSRFAVLE